MATFVWVEIKWIYSNVILVFGRLQAQVRNFCVELIVPSISLHFSEAS